MFWCCCGQVFLPGECLICGPCSFTSDGTYLIADTAHPSSAHSGHIIGGIQLSTGSRELEVVFAYQDSGNYQKLNYSWGSTSNLILVELTSMSGGSETSTASGTIFVPSRSASGDYCIDFGSYQIPNGSGTTSMVTTTVIQPSGGNSWIGFPSLITGTKVGYLNNGNGNINGFYRSSQEVYAGPTCSGCPTDNYYLTAGDCTCCPAASGLNVSKWLLDFTTSMLTNDLWGRCDELNTFYILDTVDQTNNCGHEYRRMYDDEITCTTDLGTRTTGVDFYILLKKQANASGCFLELIVSIDEIPDGFYANRCTDIGGFYHNALAVYRSQYYPGTSGIMICNGEHTLNLYEDQLHPDCGQPWSLTTPPYRSTCCQSFPSQVWIQGF